MSEKTLSREMLISAYANGFFPMPEPYTENIRWFQPDPRAIIPLQGFHCSKSLRRRLNKQEFTVTFDQAFEKVVEGCADRPDTWINQEFQRAYGDLFQIGVGHSVEVWQGEKLVGGCYGLSLGGVFFAESMFHYQTDASKVALFHLVERLKSSNFKLLEVQFLTEHLSSLGAIEIPLSEYMELLRDALNTPASFR